MPDLTVARGPELEKVTCLIFHSTLYVNVLFPKEIKLIKFHVLCQLFRRPGNRDLQGFRKIYHQRPSFR